MITIGATVGRGGRNVMNDVAHVQTLLNANLDRLTPLAPLAVDGRFGSATEGAILEARDRLQRTRVANPGLVQTADPLLALLAGGLRNGAPPAMTAQFEQLRYRGSARQMAVGRITIGVRTYAFVSGGFGRGHLPAGRYRVSTHRDERSERGFSTDGVGYTFALSDAPATRVGGADRSLLRIHPDGGSTGTRGCIGILGGAGTQRAFRSDLNAALAAMGGAADLEVRGLPST